jgi:hypothetical protein
VFFHPSPFRLKFRSVAPHSHSFDLFWTWHRNSAKLPHKYEQKQMWRF